MKTLLAAMLGTIVALGAAAEDYLVIDCTPPYAAKTYRTVADLPEGGLTNRLYARTKLVMRRIPAEAKLGADFWMGVYPLTQEQCVRLTGEPNPSVWCEPEGAEPWTTGYGEPAERPVDSLSWIDLRGVEAAGTNGIVSARGRAGNEVSRRSVLGLIKARTGHAFDLPSEAQWEFACRAGMQSMIYSGSYTEANVAAIAQCASHREANPSPVGKKLPNAFGLYDMIGNAAEFCLDQVTCVFAPYAVDPEGPETSEAPGKHVLRGGHSNTNWNYLDASVRNVCLDSDTAWFIGYRLVAPVEGQW